MKRSPVDLYKKTIYFIYLYFNTSRHRWILLTEFGWNWPGGSWEEVVWKKNKFTDGRTTSDYGGYL